MFERLGTGLGNSRGVYLGGGVGRGVVVAVDGSEEAFDSDEEPELEDVDFFLRSPGFTTKSNGQKGQQMSKTIHLQSKVNSVIVRLHVATTWFELPFCPSLYLLAICDGFVESAMTTRAIMGPRTFVWPCEPLLLLLLLERLLSLPSPRRSFSTCSLEAMDS